MATLFFVLLLSLLTTCSSVSNENSMNADEHRALLDLVGSLLADSSWTELHPQPCTDTPWPGIQCESDISDADLLHVTSIHIGPDLLSPPPCKSFASLSPASFLHFPFLKTFSLFSCFLYPNSVSLPPSLFTSTPALERLVLNGNPGLSGEIPSSVSSLQRLRVLSLPQNNFHGVIPREIGRLRALQQLDLSYNHLSGEIPEEIGRISSLSILDFSSNQLRGKLPASIGSLQSLEKIDLGFNHLSGRVPPELGELKKLVLLDFSHNNLSGPLPEELSGLKQLQYLIMENNPFNISIPFFLSSLKKLTVIGLSGCGLMGPIPPYFASLESLTALSLDNNSLNGTVPDSLDLLSNLGELNLSQNQLSGEIGFSVEFVRRLGKRLDLRGNKDLCAKPNDKYEEASVRLEAAACLGPGIDNGGKRGVVEDGDGRISSSLDGNEVENCCYFGVSSLWTLGFQGIAIVVALLV
ncbi:hypothetical protein KFK09_020792 [Dendrobium nobile]|uniref:Disease resistance R13L4/SHOC-2-like LRR domain-containing protein n=1 Tax=Dendrobium nobile TaxID=94219 RepID=A0A8T3ANE9_DENNO|nr:hypothetical protein KFK09_020792 [Dendrobium nobile]